MTIERGAGASARPPDVVSPGRVPQGEPALRGTGTGWGSEGVPLRLSGLSSSSPNRARAPPTSWQCCIPAHYSAARRESQLATWQG